jgi:hypothetical protein
VYSPETVDPGVIPGERKLFNFNIRDFMPFLFHQNMRSFGGAQIDRTAAFAAAFASIHTATGGGYWAAGFTEVMNSGASLPALQDLAPLIDPALGHLLVIEVGKTAFRTREFIGIAWNPAVLDVLFAGQVLWNSMFRRWQESYVPFADFPANATIGLPESERVGADVRGLAYIAARQVGTGNPCVVGFMHNMYQLGDRYRGLASLPTMARKVMSAIGDGFENAQVIIGGDFNVRPRNLGPRPLPLYSFAAHRVPGGFVNTTLANPYDFWLVRNRIPGMRAYVKTRTRRARASDHAAIVLRLPP